MKELIVTMRTNVFDVLVHLAKGELREHSGGVAPPQTHTFNYTDVIEALKKLKKKGLERKFTSQAEIIAYVKNKFSEKDTWYSF